MEPGIPHSRKDFIVINKKHPCILNILVAVAEDCLIKATEKFEETKKLLEKWYGPYLKRVKFISAVYCEKTEMMMKQLPMNYFHFGKTKQKIGISLQNKLVRK